MIRLPVLDYYDRPACYATEYARDSVLCHKCVHAIKCAIVCSTFDCVDSLTCVRDGLKQEIDQCHSGDVTIIYKHLFSYYFGAIIPRQFKDRGCLDCFARLQNLFSMVNVDKFLYIKAQMYGVSMATKGKGITFTPYMLLGGKAMDRYRYFLRGNRYRYGSIDGCNDTVMVMSKMVDGLVSCESRIGLHYVTEYLTSGVMDWSKAIEANEPSRSWLSMRDRCSLGYRSWAGNYGIALTTVMLEYTRVESMYRVVSSIQTGLPSRIGVREVSWRSIAMFLERVGAGSKRKLSGSLSSRCVGSLCYA